MVVDACVSQPGAAGIVLSFVAVEEAGFGGVGARGGDGAGALFVPAFESHAGTGPADATGVSFVLVREVNSVLLFYLSMIS